MKITEKSPTERVFLLEVTESELNALCFFAARDRVLTATLAANRFRDSSPVNYTYPDMNKCFK